MANDDRVRPGYYGHVPQPKPGHRQVAGRFASWHVRRRLRGFAGPGPVTGKQTQQARGEVSQAIAFLAWLHGRGRVLADCGQADVDAWYAGACTARKLTHAFCAGR